MAGGAARHFEVERGENSASPSSLPRSDLIKGEGNSRYACDAKERNMWATVQVSAEEYKEQILPRLHLQDELHRGVKSTLFLDTIQVP